MTISALFTLWDLQSMRACILLLVQVLSGEAQRSWRHRDDLRLGVASSCRYSNVPWSDCDPLSWLRTKTVELVKDKKFRLIFSLKHLSAADLPLVLKIVQKHESSLRPVRWMIFLQVSLEIFVNNELQRINCSGVKQLLNEQKILKSREEIYSKKINKINAFFEDVKVGVMKVLQNVHQLGMM